MTTSVVALTSPCGGATTKDGGIKGAAPTFNAEVLNWEVGEGEFGTKALDSGFSLDFAGVSGDAGACVPLAGELVVNEAFAGVKEGISGLKLLAP